MGQKCDVLVLTQRRMPDILMVTKNVIIVKGKPVERQGRKAKGLKLVDDEP